MFYDNDACCKFLENAVTHYETSAPIVSRFCDELYVRLGEADPTITLTELMTVQALYEQEQWEHPNYAANRIYKLLSDLKKDTTGLIGY